MRKKNKLRKRIDVLIPLLDTFIQTYPLPWSVEEDWTSEVHDANGKRIISFHGTDDAELFVRMAESRKKELDAATRFTDAYSDALASGDADTADRVLEKPPSHWHT